MKTPAFQIHNSFVTVVINSIPTTVNNNDARYSEVLKSIKSKDWAGLEQILSLPKAIARFTLGKVKIYESGVTYMDKEVHGVLAKKIIEFLTNGYPFEPLVAFLNNVMENPSQRSRDQLYTYLERYQMPIDDEGYVLAMKAIRSNFHDKYTGKIDNSVGAKPNMPRDQISDSETVHCGPGFHHGWFSFVSSYGSGDDIAVLTRFNPADVVRIPNDASYQKIVVSKYEVIKNLGPVSNIGDFNSCYAAATTQAADIVTPDEEVTATVYIDDSLVKDSDGNMSKYLVMGANAAYEAHKNGVTLTNGVVIVKPDDRKARWFFRQNKETGWTTYVAPVDKSNKAKGHKSISVDRAYQLHKAGKNVRNSGYGLVTASDKKSRKFFRQYTGWETV